MNQDLDLLQGTWTVTSLEVDRQRMSTAMIENSRIVIEGRRFTSAGIYKFEGNLLTISLSAPEAPRPTQFQVVPGDGGMLTVWKR